MKRRAMVIVALACMLLSRAGYAETTHAGSDKRVLRVVPSADLSELDPTRGANLISCIYQLMVFETLFALDSNMSPKPMMVDHESISSDGLVYTFTLRSGLKFHDASTVTTRDVVASLRRWMDGTSVGGELKSRVAGLAIVDDLTFTLSLKQPFRPGGIPVGGPALADRRHHARSRRDPPRIAKDDRTNWFRSVPLCCLGARRRQSRCV